MSTNSTSPSTEVAATGSEANFIPAPPPGVKLPPVPEDFVPATPGEFTAVVPRKSELSALPQALIDLAQFANYDATLGATAPPFAEMKSSLSVATQWSMVRQASSRWDAYAVLQEGLAWKGIRAQLESLRPAFGLAAKRDPKLTVKYAGLAKLLAAKQAIAHRGVATRRANSKDNAEGKQGFHGKSGQVRLRAAQKAAYAAQLEAAKSPPSVPATGGGGATTDSTPPAAPPVPSVTPQVAFSASPTVAPPAPAAVPAPNVVTSGPAAVTTNGTMHA